MVDKSQLCRKILKLFLPINKNQNNVRHIVFGKLMYKVVYFFCVHPVTYMPRKKEFLYDKFALTLTSASGVLTMDKRNFCVFNYCGSTLVALTKLCVNPCLSVQQYQCELTSGMIVYVTLNVTYSNTQCIIKPYCELTSGMIVYVTYFNTRCFIKPYCDVFLTIFCKILSMCKLLNFVWYLR